LRIIPSILNFRFWDSAINIPDNTSFRHACLKDVFMMSLRCLLDMRVVWDGDQKIDKRTKVGNKN